AMRRDPDARYQSAEAFRQDLLHLERVDPEALAAEVPAAPAARRAIHGPALVIAVIVAGVLGGGVVLLISRLA
ncbi:MAG TPA: hypothetical protein VHN78_05425, partial [Chloroflexota bacterium]|nr:hypothetical protein [Chloroflexota bacterium]